MTINCLPFLLSHNSHPQITGIKRKQANTVRIYLHNVNTLANPMSLSFITMMSQLFKYNVDIVLLTEINAPFKLFNYSTSYIHKLRSLWSSATANFTPDLSNNYIRSMGGVAQFNLSYSGRFYQIRSDPFSRWQTSFLYSRQHRRIAIISAYFPCINSNPKPKTNNHLLHQQLHPINDLSKPLQLNSQCWLDFTVYINELQSDNIQCIIGMDANSNPQDPRSHISQFIINCNLVDCVATMSPHQQHTATYNRGSKRIDIVLTTKILCRDIVHTSIIPSDMIIQSDHLGIILDISMEIFCCPPSTNDYKKINRKLHSTHVPSLKSI